MTKVHTYKPIVAISVALSIGGMAAASTASALPTCTPAELDENTYRELAFGKDPMYGVWGIDYAFDVYTGFIDKGDATLLGYQELDGGGTKVLVKKTYGPTESSDSGFNKFDMKMPKTGNARVRLSWDLSIRYPGCRASVTSTITGTKGRAPKLKRSYPRVTKSPSSARRGSVLWLFDVVNCRTGKFVVEVRAAGNKRKATLVANNGCDWVKSAKKGPDNIKLTGASNWKNSRARFYTTSRRTSRKTYRYKIKFRGRTLKRGSFKVRVRFKKGRSGYRIYEESDAFVNYCINESETIRSSGGRLYCYHPGTASKSYSYITGLS